MKSYFPIHMHLLALPGIRLKRNHQHRIAPNGIRQCSDYLHKLQGVQISESDDTALSAKKVKEQNLKTTAAIANEQAAKKYGLSILERQIETHKKNFTRFLILTRKIKASLESNKASLSFEVANEVGSLAEALMTFKNNSINLLRFNRSLLSENPASIRFMWM
ncbi:MAG: prephenate dehydratase domain-containing protein [Cytophagales bacterium]|nr:prephenate dehydratase domain-containing protein [Cytophagales bacterium]